MRQKHRDQGVPIDEVPSVVTDHDLERAEDTVAELERLGLYPPAERDGSLSRGPYSVWPAAAPLRDRRRRRSSAKNDATRRA